MPNVSVYTVKTLLLQFTHCRRILMQPLSAGFAIRFPVSCAASDFCRWIAKSSQSVVTCSAIRLLAQINASYLTTLSRLHSLYGVELRKHGMNWSISVNKWSLSIYYASAKCKQRKPESEQQFRPLKFVTSQINVNTYFSLLFSITVILWGCISTCYYPINIFKPNVLIWMSKRCI